MLLWLWYRQAAAALIGPLAPDLLYAASEALKRKKNMYIPDKLTFPPLLPGSLSHQYYAEEPHSIFKGLRILPSPAPITNTRQKDLEILKRPSSTLCLKRDSGKVTSYMETKL